MSASNNTVGEIAEFLQEIAPLELAEEWDNVGLLLGDQESAVRRLMTCLTLTPATVAEAVAEQAELVVVHHPLPFKPLKRITADTYAGRMLLTLLRAGIHVYSAHTAWDSASGGINEHLARRFQLQNIQPLVPAKLVEGGVGRYGILPSPLPLREFALQVKAALSASQVSLVGDSTRPVERIAVGCGSAGSLLSTALAQRCEVFVTGETNLHTCYEADGQGIALVLAGHYATERFHMETLADLLGQQFPSIRCWCSRTERTPEVVV